MGALSFTRRYRQLLLVACAVVAVIILFTLFLSREYAREAVNDVEAIAVSKMSHIYQNTQMTLDNLRVYGISIAEDRAINTWLIANDNGVMDDYNTFNVLRRYQYLQPFIFNLYLINLKADRALDANFGVSSLADFSDQSFLEELELIPPRFMTFGEHTFNERSYITLILPEPSGMSGYLVVLFDRTMLEQYLLRNDSGVGLSIQILNQDNSLMLGDPAGFSELDLPSDSERQARRGLHRTEVKAGDRSLLLASAYLDLYDWTLFFASDRAEMTQNIGQFTRKITMACLILLAALLGLIIWGSVTTLRPFQHIAKEFQGRLGPEFESPPRGEADIIRTGFEYLLDSVQQMNTSLRNYRVIAKEEYLRQWILQGQENHILSPLKEMSKLPSLTYIRMVIIRIESYKHFADEYNYHSRKLLKYAMGNIANEIAQAEGFEAESVDMDGDHFVLMFAPLQGSANSDPESMLISMQGKILELLKVSTAIAVSDSLETSENFRKVYDETYDLTLLKFLTGESKVFHESDLEMSFETTKTLPDDLQLNELIRAVKASDSDQMKLLLGQLLNGLRVLPLDELHFQLRMIVYTLFKSFSKVINLQEESSTDTLLNRFSSLTDVERWLEEKLNGIMHDQKNKPAGGRKDEIAQEIIDYIQNHLQDPMLSLDSIRDHLGLSNSYVRHVFKEVYDVTLADYILQERIDRVKKLLVTTDHTIADIAEMAGFQTKSHFYNAFKRSEGMTPAQYRGQNQN